MYSKETLVDEHEPTERRDFDEVTKQVEILREILLAHSVIIGEAVRILQQNEIATLSGFE